MMRIERGPLVLALGTAGLAILLVLGYMGSDDPNEAALNDMSGVESGALAPASVSGHDRVGAFPPAGFDAAARAVPPDIDIQSLDVATWRSRGLDPLLNADLVRIFEQLIGRFPSDPSAQLAARVPAEYLGAARALLEKYLRYREELALLQPAAGGQTHSEILAGILARRMDLQRKHFSEAEIAGLFADDNRYDAFTAERLKLTERGDPGELQQDEAIAKLAGAMLTTDQREARQVASLPVRVMAQNAALDKSAATTDERLAARSAAFGAEAAARMAEVDRSEAVWQQRIARLAEAAPAEQPRLRSSLFTPAEQLRLDGALALHRSRQGLVQSRL